MKTYWQVVESGRPPTSRFTCADCGYDTMVKSHDRGTIRFDCVFCGWGCFADFVGWWHQKTSQEWEQEAYEEQFG